MDITGLPAAPALHAMHDFDVLLINALDVLAHGDKKYAVQFMNKFRATYLAYRDLHVDLPHGDDAMVRAHVSTSFVLQQAAQEPFFTTAYPFFDQFRQVYLLACEMVLSRQWQADSAAVAYTRVWAGHERLVAFMESILYAVSSRRTRALLVGLSGTPTGLDPALAIITAK